MTQPPGLPATNPPVAVPPALPPAEVSASPQLDRRRHAYRDDLAAESLRGRVEAERFCSPRPHQVMRSAIAMRRQPSAAAGLETEVLFGEIVDVYDVAEGWAWGQLARDGYVGYMPADALSGNIASATHRVSSIGTFLYSAADIKSPPLMHLSLNAPLCVAETVENFARLETGGFVVTRHIAAKDKPARDFVEIAERLTGTPYLWGGRTRVGVDCSGLVQLAMEAAGLPCPRDSDMQKAEIGVEIPIPSSLTSETKDVLQRGDLIFWRGHVGLMIDAVMLLHANAHHMAVVAEPLEPAVARIARTGGPITAIKRPAGLAALA